MKFTPKTEEEVGFTLLPTGTYPFQVISAQDKTSKGGNEMIEMKVQVRAASGQTSMIRDYLLEKVDYKLRHFCYGTDLGQTYENGEIIARYCEGRQGYAQVDVEKYVHDGREREKNIITDYLKKDEWPKAQKQPAKPAPKEEEDDIQF